MDVKAITSSSARPRVTLEQVAQAAGLSQTAVSLALNRHPKQCHLSPKTRKLALETARRLGYRANWRARALAKGQTFTIGMVYARQAPFMTAVNELIVNALSETFHSSGYHQLLVPLLGGPEDWEDVIRPDRLDGCVVLYPMPSQLGEILSSTVTPMVLINLLSDLAIPQVLADDRGGMRLLMQHLLELGHREIALVFRQRHPHYSAVHRREAYEQTMREAGLAAQIRVIENDSVEPMVDEVASGRSPMTAAICFDHVLAAEVLHKCWRRGVRVPHDLSVATFNDVYPTGAMIPPLTAVSLPGEAIGKRSAHLLLELIKDRKKSPEDVVAETEMVREWLPEGLVVRESTGRPRVEVRVSRG